MIVAGIATIPGRESCLTAAIASLINQVDLLCISVNPGTEILHHWKSAKTVFIPIHGTDERKFEGLKHCGFSDTYFSCDDDIIYPPDYVSRTLHGFENRPMIVTHHGRIIKSPLTTYYRYRGKQYCFRDDQLKNDVFVNVPGTGVMAFRVRDITSLKNAFDPTFQRMADIHMGIFAQKNQLPIKVLPHQENWLRDNTRSSKIPSIQFSSVDESRQVELCNSIKWNLYK